MFRKWGQLLLPALLLAACHGDRSLGEPSTRVASTRQPALTSTVSALDTPEPFITPVVSPLPPEATSVPAMPIPTPSGVLTDIYVVQEGDTLSGIAYYECGCEVDELAALNNITDTAAIQVGQPVLIPFSVDLTGPNDAILPDSEVVYGPAYVDFDVAAFVEKQGGYLSTYRERISGQDRNASEVIELIAQNFSMGPRVLLALLEYRSHWVTGSPQSDMETRFPLSHGRGGNEGLYFQLGWAADALGEGYYGYKRSGTVVFKLSDGSRILAASGQNAGSVAVQNALARVNDQAGWYAALEPSGFLATYERLFGKPETYAVEPLVPADLRQPALALPWQGGHTWYLSGGPHEAWLDGSAWAAVDFAPPDVKGHCGVSEEWATAAAGGVVMRNGEGQVLVDLDGDGHEQTGWVLFYLHVVPDEALQVGALLAPGDVVGHPSCAGGQGDSSHLHFARKYNGEWMAADGPVPMVLSGWQAVNGVAPYEGSMKRGAEVREACECWDDAANGITSDNVAIP